MQSSNSLVMLSPVSIRPADQVGGGFGAQATPLSQTQAVVLAQQFDQDILGDLGTMAKNFVDSGQLWALIIGVVLGYMFRSMTTYK
ncbi:hypothetical protein [Leptolyngbya sp. PCC 6406]|uniref:hypothetical protein n=1 Tax=Leptolyngbya sp. PCC 6406 TaxID=1173264 RepID=UPI0002AC6259|nr:hypothetical protein [Leptolyngbya sp. PCC 6406]